MDIVKIDVKTVTPTLMGGGVSQNDGIRPSEIKGVMRYWFRALAGFVFGNDIKALKSLEDKVFGSQARMSPFRINISDENLIIGKLNFSSLPVGTKYLAFVINLNRHRMDNVILPGSEFAIKFLFRPSIVPSIRNLVVLSFYLASALGGFGLRTRRGFGSWQIIGCSNKIYDFELKSYDEHSIKNAINIGLKEIKSIAENINYKNTYEIPSYNIIDNKFLFKAIEKEASSWEALLDEIGAYYRGFRVSSEKPKKDDFRPKTTEDYKRAINAIRNGQKVVELNNVAFGLNIRYRNYFSVDIQKKEENKFTTLRRGSQLFISIKKLEDKRYLAIFSNFLSEFKPKDNRYSVIVNSRSFKPFVKIDDVKFYNIRNRFISFMEKNEGC